MLARLIVCNACAIVVQDGSPYWHACNSRLLASASVCYPGIQGRQIQATEFP